MTVQTGEVTYPLTITADYVHGWGFWEAARELLQNAIDQQTLNATSPMHWCLNEQGEELTIGNPGCRLEPSTLLLGASGKRNDERMVGRHGEGFKLAVIALLREGCDVNIANNDEVWTPVLREHPAYGAETLHFDVRPADEATDGVWFIVVGPAVAEHAAQVRECYVEAPPNTILPGQVGRVYVSGLFVTQVEEFEHGYNFGPERLQLDRDRQKVGTFDLAWETSRLWRESSDNDERWRLLENGARDVEHLENHRPQHAAIASEFRRRYPNTVPVKDQSEIEAAVAEGRRWKLVPQTLYKLLQASAAFFRPRTSGSPRERLRRFLKRWGWVLPAEAKNELEDIITKMGPAPEETTDES